jgi:hypothetical protein
MVLNVSGEICSLAQGEEPPGMTKQLQQTTKTKKMVKIH